MSASVNGMSRSTGFFSVASTTDMIPVGLAIPSGWRRGSAWRETRCAIIQLTELAFAPSDIFFSRS